MISCSTPKDLLHYRTPAGKVWLMEWVESKQNEIYQKKCKVLHWTNKNQMHSYSLMIPDDNTNEKEKDVGIKIDCRLNMSLQDEVATKCIFSFLQHKNNF